MCRHALNRFSCSPEAARTGRRFVAQVLEEWGVGPGDPAAASLDDLILLSSELLTNAVKACSGDIVVEITAHRDSIELAVEDDSPLAAVLRRPDESGGRGLHIVEALATRWGQQPASTGHKRVWCQMAVPVGSIIGEGCRL